MAPYLRNIRSTGAAEFDDLIALFKQLRYDGRGWDARDRSAVVCFRSCAIIRFLHVLWLSRRNEEVHARVSMSSAVCMYSCSVMVGDVA